MARVVYNYPVIRRDLYGNGGAVWRAMRRKGALGTQLAKAQVGVDTGALRSSISYDISSVPYRVTVNIVASDSKAVMHHEGTKPHIIKASRTKVLKFRYGGEAQYTAVVHHPGSRANRFLSDQLPKLV